MMRTTDEERELSWTDEERAELGATLISYNQSSGSVNHLTNHLVLFVDHSTINLVSF